MSASSRSNNARAQTSADGPSYKEMRDRVAPLIRQDKAGASPSLVAQLRPTQEESHSVTLLKAERSEANGRELNSALDTLSRATSCFDLLARKLDEVEGERDEVMVRLAEHKRSASTWAGMIEIVQAKLRNVERDLADMRQEAVAQQERARTAEERLAQLEIALKQKDLRIRDMEGEYFSLHDRVMSSFGRGSPTHRTLEILVDRFQAAVA